MIRRDISLLLLLLAGCSNPVRGVPIFLWHAVGAGCAGGAYDVSPAEFEQELADLERWRAHPVTLQQLFDAREGKGVLPERPVVLTFDDGRLCQLTDAAPILVRHHMVAESFVIAGATADDAAHRARDADSGPNGGFLTWPELREAEASGAFVIESHGVHHVRLASLAEDEQRQELAESKRLLESKLGHPVPFFAYPFGSFTGATRTLAEQAGYRAALSVQKGWGRRYELKRVSLHAGDRGALQAALREAFGSP